MCKEHYTKKKMPLGTFFVRDGERRLSYVAADVTADYARFHGRRNPAVNLESDANLWPMAASSGFGLSWADEIPSPRRSYRNSHAPLNTHNTLTERFYSPSSRVSSQKNSLSSARAITFL